MTILSNQIVGSELSLECGVTIVRGVTSSVDILWMINDKVVEEMNDGRISISSNASMNNIYTSSLRFLYLSEDDKSIYTCMVIILDTNTSRSVELYDFDCKSIM